MRRPPARLLLAGSLVAAGAGVVVGTALPWLTTSAGLQGYAAVDELFGQVLAGLGGLVALAGLALGWRETAPGRWAVLVAALAAALLSGWMVAQAEATYADLATDAPTVAARGPGGFVALACALLATGLALVPVPPASVGTGRATRADAADRTPVDLRRGRPGPSMDR